ncbi:MAG: tetratricopeptide repeat protein [Planctomycetes bacterium]|nr:tetratricopeptide repeat protein [Planctomycetota bacterium]
MREAEGYLELGLPQLALDRLERMKDPGTFRGHQLSLMGEALRSLQRYEQAVTVLEEATDLTPSNLHAWLTLGWCLKRSRRLDQAISALERARDVSPTEAIVHYNLACYYSLARRKSEALSCLQRAIEMQPDYRDAIGDERDFDPLRADPDFQALMTIIV